MPYTISAQSKTGGTEMSTSRTTAKEALERARELEAADMNVTIIDVNTGQAYSPDKFAALQEKS